MSRAQKLHIFLLLLDNTRKADFYEIFCTFLKIITLKNERKKN